MKEKTLKDKRVLLGGVLCVLVFLALLIPFFSVSKTRSANISSSEKGVPAFIFRDNLKRSDLGGGFIRQYLGAGENINAQHIDMADGSIVKMHKHTQEQFGYVIRGSLKVTIGNETQILKGGDAYFIPSGVLHGFTAIGQTEAIDVFSPMRPEIE